MYMYYESNSLVLCHLWLVSLQDDWSHILHSLKETDCETLVRKLFSAAHSPEAVAQIIVLNAAVLLDLSVSAVVVGQKESLRRYELSCAASAKQHDCVLQRCLIDAVDVFSRKTEAFLLHVCNAVSDQ